MAQKPHEPTDYLRGQVEAMSAYGIPQLEIAAALGMSDKTLRKYYATEIATGATKANAKIAECLFNSAKNGNTTAQIFWLKTRAGWRDTLYTEQKVETRYVAELPSPLIGVDEWQKQAKSLQ